LFFYRYGQSLDLCGAPSISISVQLQYVQQVQNIFWCESCDVGVVYAVVHFKVKHVMVTYFTKIMSCLTETAGNYVVAGCSLGLKTRSERKISDTEQILVQLTIGIRALTRSSEDIALFRVSTLHVSR